MDFVFIAAVIEERELQREEKIKKRLLRDKSDPLNLPDSLFVDHYRVNKEGFVMIMDSIKPFAKESSVPLILQLAGTLRFFAEGGFQRSIENDINISLGRPTFSKIFGQMLQLLQSKLCPVWIDFNMNESEKQKSKRYFLEQNGIPGVIVCIDGTHVKLLQPPADGSLYYNRKGNFSINVMLVCDYDMKIRAVDSTHPGSAHDAFIRNLSEVKHYLRGKYESGERGSWLLGDAGYPLEPFLITPYRNAASGTLQARFNKIHASCRNIVERTIGVLKSRFKCLTNTLYYKPEKIVKIVNICVALHNIYRHYKLDYEVTSTNENIEEAIDPENVEEHRSNGVRVRDEIVNSL